MKHTLLSLAILASFSMIGFSQQVDTIIRSIQPVNSVLPANTTSTQTIAFRGHTMPYFSTVLDVDLYLDITHGSINDLKITIYSPYNSKATVMTANSCSGQPVQFPGDIKVTFNDQIYNFNVYNSTGQEIAAPYTCTTAKPSVGAFNNGHMKPQGDQLLAFNSNNWILGGQCGASYQFSAKPLDIDAATNRISNFGNNSVYQFLQKGGFKPGDRLLLTYNVTKGGVLGGLKNNQVYLFQVINDNVIELLTITGSDITNVPPGSLHEFVFLRDWLLVVEDTKIGGGGKINEVALKLSIVDEPCNNPEKVDDMGNLLPDNPAEIRSGLENIPLIVYPNPFGDQVSIGMVAEGVDGKLTIRSMDGRLIYGPVQCATLQEVSTSAWPSGMYLAEWRDALATKQVLIMKD